MLKGFIDDSGSGGDSEWYILAGYIGTVEDWDRFDLMWLEVLHEHPRIESFKASSAESLKGSFTGLTIEQRNNKIDRLIGVIGKCSRRAVSARMRQRDYDEIVKGKVPTLFDSPYYFLFPLIMGAAVNIEMFDGRTDSIDFIFDEDQAHEKGVKRLVPRVAEMTSLHGRVANIARRDDEEVLPLQAADLLAWQTRRFFCRKDEPRRPHFDAARNCPPESPHSFIMNRQMLQDGFDELMAGATQFMLAKIEEQYGRQAVDDFIEQVKRSRN